MERPEYLTSIQLYNSLCRFVGSEKVVKARRIFFKVLDKAFQNDRKWRVVNSGSKAEGLDLTGSDLDIMYINVDDIVYNTSSQISTHLPFGLVIATDNSHAGFAHIRLHLFHNTDATPAHAFFDNNRVLTNDSYKSFFHSKLSEKDRQWKAILAPVHGPCTSTANGAFDFLHCYRCLSWPAIAHRWILRPRVQGWPSSDVISDILQDDVLLVPIGSKSSLNQENPFEWRISFSIAEKMLVHSFNHTQLLCYSMLKLVLKEILNKDESTQDLMCSYFMKTVLFWLIEETGSSPWKPFNLIKCFHMCIKRLLYLVANGTLPNYFIPENNMIEYKLCGRSQDHLLLALQSICSESVIQRLYTLVESQNELSLTRHKMYIEVDRAIYPLLHYFRGIASNNLESALVKSMKFLQHCGKSSTLKNICFQWLIRIFGRIGSSYWNFQRPFASLNNKTFYVNYKRFICFHIVNTFSDSMSGWLLLANFLINHKQAGNAFKIVDYVLSLQADRKLMSSEIRPHPQTELLQRVGLTFYQRYKFSCFDYVIIPSRCSEQDIFHFLDPGLSDVVTVPITSPRSFAFYLQIMSYGQLGNATAKKEAIKRLELCIQNYKDMYEFIFSLECLLTLHDGWLVDHSFDQDFVESFFSSDYMRYVLLKCVTLFPNFLTILVYCLEQMDLNHVKDSLKQKALKTIRSVMDTCSAEWIDENQFDFVQLMRQILNQAEEYLGIRQRVARSGKSIETACEFELGGLRKIASHIQK